MVQAFRFAVQTTTANTATEWRDLARRVEDAGYSTLFLADHYIGPGPVSDKTFLRPQQLAPIAAMAAAAAWTTSLRVGCRVFCVDYHVPAALAKEIATMDMLSRGRLEVGLGAGVNAGEYEAMGLAFAEAPRRVTKLEEMVELVKLHSTGEQLNFEGGFVTANGYAGRPIPVQSPHPTIMIGGARKRVLTLAATEADIVSLNNVEWHPVNAAGRTPMQELQRRHGIVRDAAGDRFGHIEVETAPYAIEMTESVPDALERWAKRLRVVVPEITPESLSEHPNVLIGPVDKVVERLQQLREELDINYFTVPRKQIDDFAPVVARLAGT